MDVNALRLGDSRFSSLEKNQTAEAAVDRAISVFFIPTIWATLCLVSSFVLLAAGAGSVFFVHQATGPEVLGYATTAVRDNRLMAIPEDAEKLDGLDLALLLRERRVRYGVSTVAGEGEKALGVGDEMQTTKI